MQVTKDPAIKLFGTQILPVPSADVSGDDVTSLGIDSAENHQHGEEGMDDDDGEEEIEKDPGVEKSLSVEEADAPASNGEDSTTLETSHESDIPKSPSTDEGTAKSEAPKTLKEGKNKPSSEEKTPKKPDKILPCPRCNSMDTKFCYYNNYNVNQPRHFCKSCQRYWTAGGTMRNVPVGAGRRKNKSSSSHHSYQHVTISEAPHDTQIDASNGTHLMHFKSNGETVQRLGLESPRYDSVVSALCPAEKKVLNGTRNGFHNFEGGGVPCSNGGNGDDCSSGSSVTVSNSMDEETGNGQKEQKAGNHNGYAPQMQCFPWPYPWNPALPPGMAIPIYPAAAVWNCGMHCTWNVPSLGKHPREGDLLEGSRDNASEQSLKRKNGSVLVPKTLRIDDPKEAAKSTIWATLGIKNDSSINSGLFKAFQQKGDNKKPRPEPSPLLHANPAALSRSLKFHETS